MTTQRPLRILLVEDDSAIANVIAIAMQNLGVPYHLSRSRTICC
jgi:CheY-like chemotaxis protein